MTEFNTRTTINHQLQLDKSATQRRSQKARQRIVYRHRRAALRNAFRTVAIDAALVGCIFTACVVLLACAII